MANRGFDPYHEMMGRVSTVERRRPHAVNMALALGLTFLAVMACVRLGPDVAQSWRPTGSSRPGIWISVSEIRAKPMSGAAWNQVKARADGAFGTPSIANQDSNHDVSTLAAAYVYARTGQASYWQKARNAIMGAIGTESGGTVLALGRNLVSYVISADLISLSGTDDQQFRSWLTNVLGTRMSDGRSLREAHEQRPNNFGTHAGASRAAAVSYLGNTNELARVAQVFSGWLGDRSSYAGFKYGDLSWQCNPSAPVGINPRGCFKNGYSVDGVLADDQRRSGGFTWPPPKENYVYEALQGAVVEAEILYRAGYPAWTWRDNALLRAFTWLHEAAGYPAQGDDQWQPWLINKRYGTRFPVANPARTGKNMGFTDWTHA